MSATGITRRVALGDVEIAYEDRGSGARALVLVHGFTGSRDDFADVVDDLAALGRVVLVDQRGHGASSSPGAGYAFGQLAADLNGVLDAAGVARADLLGHSLGGMVALRHALAHPGRVASLILMDTGARAVPGFAEMIAPAVASVERHGMSRLVAAAQRTPLAGEEADIAALEGEERYRATTAAKLAAMDPRALVDLAAAISQQASLVARLGEIRCPTAVLVGESDLRFLPLADELAAGIPGAVLVRIPGGGHSPQRSARAAWLAAVRAHVERARAGA